MLHKYEAHIFQNGPKISGSNDEVLCVFFQFLFAKWGQKGFEGETETVITESILRAFA